VADPDLTPPPAFPPELDCLWVVHRWRHLEDWLAVWVARSGDSAWRCISSQTHGEGGSRLPSLIQECSIFASSCRIAFDRLGRAGRRTAARSHEPIAPLSSIAPRSPKKLGGLDGGVVRVMQVDVPGGRDRRLPEFTADDVKPSPGSKRRLGVGVPRSVDQDRRNSGRLCASPPPTKRRTDERAGASRSDPAAGVRAGDDRAGTTGLRVLTAAEERRRARRRTRSRFAISSDLDRRLAALG
jgi:hypothetical protein